MTLIDFGDFKIRFDPKEVRISIDGEIIDIGRVFSSDEKISARRIEEDYKIVEGGFHIYLDKDGERFRIYDSSNVVDHPNWTIDTLSLSEDGTERMYQSLITGERLKRSDLMKRLSRL